MKLLKFLTIPLLSVLLVTSCEKDEQNANPKLGSLQLMVQKNESTLKSGAVPAAVIVSIKNQNGQEILSAKKIDLLKFNTEYITKPIELAPGNYKLSEYLVVDAEGTVIYAAPIEGSPKAYLVNDPLDIDFAIIEDQVTKLTPEVLSTEVLTAADFGYLTFSLNEVKTITFLTSIFIYNETTKNLELTTANLIIAIDEVPVYNFNIEAITNKLTVANNASSYKLIFSKNGYINYSITLTNEELNNCFTQPITIVLKNFDLLEGLIAYYPFNGNANDESGNGNNGIVNGPTLIEDRNGNTNAAYYFDGINDFINCGNNNSLSRYNTSFSIACWVKPNSFSTSSMSIILSNRTKINDNLNGSFLAIWGSYNTFDLYSRIQFGHNGGAEYQSITTESTANIGNWVFVVVNYTFNGNNNNTVSIYYNGVKETEAVFNNINDPLDAPTYIGFEPASTIPAQYHFHGLIDDIRLYNRTLTETEIAHLLAN